VANRLADGGGVDFDQLLVVGQLAERRWDSDFFGINYIPILGVRNNLITSFQNCFGKFYLPSIVCVEHGIVNTLNIRFVRDKLFLWKSIMFFWEIQIHRKKTEVIVKWFPVFESRFNVVYTIDFGKINNFGSRRCEHLNTIFTFWTVYFQ
jgi:hypothetical protein